MCVCVRVCGRACVRGCACACLRLATCREINWYALGCRCCWRWPRARRCTGGMGSYLRRCPPPRSPTVLMKVALTDFIFSLTACLFFFHFIFLFIFFFTSSLFYSIFLSWLLFILFSRSSYTNTPHTASLYEHLSPHHIKMQRHMLTHTLNSHTHRTKPPTNTVVRTYNTDLFACWRMRSVCFQQFVCRSCCSRSDSAMCGFNLTMAHRFLRIRYVCLYIITNKRMI